MMSGIVRFKRNGISRSHHGLAASMAYIVFIVAGCSPHSETLNPPTDHQHSDRTIVFIVAGTYGNDQFWPLEKTNSTTFGSELLSGLGDGNEVYPFLWASSIDHKQRIEAAQNLASLIDEKAAPFDRVCLVGHSHGGNVALLATGLCHSPIDMVVCLSTPHPYLRTQLPDGSKAFLPVYCSPKAWENISDIVTIRMSSDRVPDELSNALPIGLNKNEAIRLSEEWIEAVGHPRLDCDSLIHRILESDSIVASSHLLVAKENLTVKSLVSDPLGVKPHNTVHSRRMGRVVGELLRDGLTAERIDYIESLIQLANADTGEPVEDD